MGDVIYTFRYCTFTVQQGFNVWLGWFFHIAGFNVWMLYFFGSNVRFWTRHLTCIMLMLLDFLCSP